MPFSAPAIIAHRLVVQSNGWIVLETEEPGRLHTGPARDLVFRLQYKSTKGWWAISGEFSDELTARQCLREAIERNHRIEWRLVASNEYGVVALPNNWKGRI